MDAALVNVGLMMAQGVAGRVVVEVDPRLSDAGACVHSCPGPFHFPPQPLNLQMRWK